MVKNKRKGAQGINIILDKEEAEQGNVSVHMHSRAWGIYTHNTMTFIDVVLLSCGEHKSYSDTDTSTDIKIPILCTRRTASSLIIASGCATIDILSNHD